MTKSDQDLLGEFASDQSQDAFTALVQRHLGLVYCAALRQVRLALLEADVDFQVARKFIARVKEKALGEAVVRSITPGQQIVKIFHDELTALLGSDSEPLRLQDGSRILIVGLNGSGKTTSSAKLARSPRFSHWAIETNSAWRPTRRQDRCFMSNWARTAGTR